MALAKSHSQSVLPNPRSLVLETIEQSEDYFLLSVHVEQASYCPECGQHSISRHSSYVRRLQDLPWQGLTVQILLRVRRFRCRNRGCPRKVFTERVEGIPSYLRQTIRLAEIVRVVGYAAGGLPGTRLLARLSIRTSDDTVLRRVKTPAPPAPSDPSNSLEVLGVDDWAWRKGQSYGTILVDLEQRSVSDLLPDRSAQSFGAWLQQQPRIRVISRDRGGIYAEGAQLGSPAARQVADRFHLFLNLSTAIERALEERRSPIVAQSSRAATTQGRSFGCSVDPPAGLATGAPPAPLGTLWRSDSAPSSGLLAEKDQQNTAPGPPNGAALDSCRSVSRAPASPAPPRESPPLRRISAAALGRGMPQRHAAFRRNSCPGLSRWSQHGGTTSCNLEECAPSPSGTTHADNRAEAGGDLTHETSWPVDG